MFYDTEDLKDLIGSSEVVINLTCVDEKEKYIQEIMAALPQFTSCEVIGGNGYGTSYYLH